MRRTSPTWPSSAGVSSRSPTFSVSMVPVYRFKGILAQERRESLVPMASCKASLTSLSISNHSKMGLMESKVTSSVCQGSMPAGDNREG